MLLDGGKGVAGRKCQLSRVVGLLMKSMRIDMQSTNEQSNHGMGLGWRCDIEGSVGVGGVLIEEIQSVQS